jgi:hypothetical protein
MKLSHPFPSPWKSPSAVISHITTARRLRTFQLCNNRKRQSFPSVALRPLLAKKISYCQTNSTLASVRTDVHLNLTTRFSMQLAR